MRRNDSRKSILEFLFFGPIAVAQAFGPHLERGTGRRMAFISSILASIGGNTDGGYILYRSTKAGLNAAISVRGMRRQIAAAERQDSGRFISHEGVEIPW